MKVSCLKEITYELASHLGSLGSCELNEAEASRLVAVLDADTGGENLTELSEIIVQILVGPVTTETLYKNVGLRGTIPQEVLVVG